MFYFGSDSDFELFWESPDGPLHRKLETKYGVYARDFINADNPTLLGQIDLYILFHKLQEALGFVLSERALAAHQADLRSGLYAFLAEDVERLQPVCKHTHLVNLAGGVSLYFKAKSRFDRQSSALLSLALDLLKQAHAAAPFDKEVIFYLAKTYHAMLIRAEGFSVSDQFETSSDTLASKALEYYQAAMTSGWDSSRCYKNKLRVCVTAAKQTRRDEYFHLAASLLAEFSEALEKKADVISFLGRLSTKPDLSVGAGAINLLQLAHLSDTFKAVLIPNLKRLDIRGAAFASPSLLQKLFTSSLKWQLEEISLGHCSQLDDATFSTLLANLDANLVTKIYLNDCWRLSDASLVLAAEKLSRVEVLNIAGCVGMTGETIVRVLKWEETSACSFPVLKIFTCLGIKQIDFTVLRAALQRPRLRKLNVDGISAGPRQLPLDLPIACSELVHFSCEFKLEPAFLVHVLKHTPQLRSLELSMSEDLTDKDIIDVITLCPELLNLTLGTNHSWTDAVLDTVVANGSKIQTLEINSQLFTREALSRVSRGLPSLTSVAFLSRSKFFDSEMLQSLATRSKQISNVCLVRLDDDVKPKIDSTHWLPSILLTAPNLTQLKFDKCKLDDKNAPIIFRACSKLQAVSLYNCPYEGQGLHLLVGNNPDLLSLQMVNCWISSHNMMEMSKHMSATGAGQPCSLRSLFVMSCTAPDLNFQSR